MLLIEGETPELHLKDGEDITVILPDGDEIYINADGCVANSQGVRIGPHGDKWEDEDTSIKSFSDPDKRGD